MTGIEEKFAIWRSHVSKREQNLLDEMSVEERADAFCHDIAFGADGFRGKIGLGPNRMNAYTVGRATQGLANYLNARFDKPSVALCRDTRHGSEAFVRRTAEVLAANGVRVRIFERDEPAPALSFAMREMGCSAGVRITASHNPAAYNGYRVHGFGGRQVTAAAARTIRAAIEATDAFAGVRSMPFEEAQQRELVSWIPEHVLDKYLEEVLGVSTGEDCSGLRVAFVPMRGVGIECARRVLGAIGVGEVTIVEGQGIQNSGFTTRPSPDAKKPAADLLVTTGPDANHVGVAVLRRAGHRILSGDEIGLLLLDFLAGKAAAREEGLSRRVAITTVVSMPMADELARSHGFELRRTLAGFESIGEQILLLEEEGRTPDLLMGFEESCGCLAGTTARDKDAIAASLLVCELAAHWKERGLDLGEAMDRLYRQYGYWDSSSFSITRDSSARIAEIMSGIRKAPPASLGGLGPVRMIDYANGIDMPMVNPSGPAEKLPAANAIELRLDDGSRILFRPGEPKPKIEAHVFARGALRVEAESKLTVMRSAVREIMGGAH